MTFPYSFYHRISELEVKESIKEDDYGSNLLATTDGAIS